MQNTFPGVLSQRGSATYAQQKHLTYPLPKRPDHGACHHVCSSLIMCAQRGALALAHIRRSALALPLVHLQSLRLVCSSCAGLGSSCSVPPSKNGMLRFALRGARRLLRVRMWGPAGSSHTSLNFFAKVFQAFSYLLTNHNETLHTSPQSPHLGAPVHGGRSSFSGQGRPASYDPLPGLSCLLSTKSAKAS